MHQVNLSDQVYQEAQLRAAEAGFHSVDDYIADLVTIDLAPPESLDQFFTPERLAIIDRASVQVASGEFYTTAQATEELDRRRDQWLRQNPSRS